VVLPEELIEKLQEENSRDETILYLGFKLPIGWEVSDSICFVGDVGGIFTYSEKRTAEMETIEPAEHNHYWWVGETTPPLSITCGSLYCYPEFVTDSQTGNFLVDYMLGYNGSINTCRRNDQFINIGAKDTAYVTSPNEFGPGSINEAIDLVKQGGVIMFDFYQPETISITEEIRLYKDVTILGNENRMQKIAGEHPCRIIKVEEGLTINISNLQIENGNADYGGGLYCGERSIVTLHNTTFKNNNADYGGAIYCDLESTLNLNNALITSNSADNGGGIYCDSKARVSLENAIVTDNVASSSGGGIYASSSELIFTDITLNTNTAIKGGAVYSTGNSPVFERVNICKNNAELGGGIYFDNAPTPILKNVFITENSAANGGGGVYINNSYPQFDSEERCNIYLNGSMSGGDLFTNTPIDVIVDTFSVMSPNVYHTMPLSSYSFDIQNGKIQQIDGDLYVSPLGNNEASGLNENDPLKNIWFALSKILADSLHNHTIYLSEGIYSPTSNNEFFPIIVLEYINIEGISENTTILDAEGKNAVFKLFMINNASLSNMTITGGSRQEGGGIYCDNSNPVIQNLIIKANSAHEGGGIYCKESDPIMQNLNIEGNNAENGGGIYCNESHPEIRDVSINYNMSDGSGGGLNLYMSDPKLNNVIISHNQADYGGAIRCWYSNPLMNGLTINDNVARKGGGMYLYYSDPSINNIDIYQNRSSDRGGAFYVLRSEPTFVNVRICGNGAVGNGGGIYCSMAEPVFYNTIFSDNTTEACGGGICCNRSDIFLSNVTVLNNSAAIEGGGMFSILNTNSFITNSIFWNNFPDEICLSPGFSSNILTLSYSDIKGDTAGVVGNENIVNWMNGNIAADPQFCGDGTNPCELRDFSPCIDAGNQDTTGLNLPLWDFLGENRIIDGNGDGNAVVDMGAYEFAGMFVGVGGMQVANCRLGVFPNPASGLVQINFTSQVTSHISPVASQTELSILDMNGNKIQTLVNKNQSPGEYTIQFNASTLPAGIYLVRLQAGEGVVTKKLVVMR